MKIRLEIDINLPRESVIDQYFNSNAKDWVSGFISKELIGGKRQAINSKYLTKVEKQGKIYEFTSTIL